MKEFFNKWFEWSEKGKEWWSSLPLQKRKALTVGGLFLSLFIIYQWIWSPLVEQADNMRRHLADAQKTFVWMQTADKEMRTLEDLHKHKTATFTPIALLDILQKNINQAGLSSNLTELKQASKETILIHFQKVEFDAFIQMLITLMKEQSLTISQLSVTAQNSQGLVNVEMVVQL
jgi:general secretion pathway protein M